jgi:hypothetical protein
MLFAALLTAVLSLSASWVRAAHNTVTVANPRVTYVGQSTWVVSSTATVRNTTGNTQTGQLTLLVFQVMFDGRVVQIARRDLGQVDLPPSASAPGVPFTVNVHSNGSYILMADYKSSTVAHTHSGTIDFFIN